MKVKSIIFSLSVILIMGLIMSCSTTNPTPTPTPTPTTTPTATTTSSPFPITTTTPKPTTTTTTAATTTTTSTFTPKPGTSITLKLCTLGGPGHGARIEMEHFMAAVQQRSGGRIGFDYYPAEALFTLKESFDACRTGLTDIAHISYIYEPDRLGLLGLVPVMPGNFHLDKFIEHYRDPGGFHDWASTYCEKWNLKLLASSIYATGYDINSRVPIKKLEDFKGKIIKAPGAVNEAMKLLGATPVAITMDQVFEALQRGTIDAQMSSLDTIVTQKWYEVGPYVVITRMITPPIGMVMNTERYKGLAPEYRKIIDASVLQMHEEVKNFAFKNFDKYTAALKANPKVDFYVVPDDELSRWLEAIKPLFDQYQAKYGNDWTRFMEIRKNLW